jgi:hypothetical protein
MSDRDGRAGTIVGGVFLIGLGLVFLFRDQLHVEWGLVWPFFLIVPGAFILVRSLTIGEPGQKTGGLIGGAILVFLGAVFLLENYYDLDWQKIWPFFLIIPGVGLLIGALRGRPRRRDRWSGGPRAPGGSQDGAPGPGGSAGPGGTQGPSASGDPPA